MGFILIHFGGETEKEGENKEAKKNTRKKKKTIP